jgi:hypothetical protein
MLTRSFYCISAFRGASRDLFGNIKKYRISIKLDPSSLIAPELIYCVSSAVLSVKASLQKLYFTENSISVVSTGRIQWCLIKHILTGGVDQVCK